MVTFIDSHNPKLALSKKKKVSSKFSRAKFRCLWYNNKKGIVYFSYACSNFCHDWSLSDTKKVLIFRSVEVIVIVCLN